MINDGNFWLIFGLLFVGIVLLDAMFSQRQTLPMGYILMAAFSALAAVAVIQFGGVR